MDLHDFEDCDEPVREPGEEDDVICLGSNESEERVGVTNSPQTEQPKDNEVENAKKRKKIAITDFFAKKQYC